MGLALPGGALPIGDGAQAAATRAFAFGKTKELGLHRVRTDFDWSLVEPSRGQRDFSKYDRLVAEARAQAIDLLAILDYGNAWATSAPNADEYYPPDDPNDFAAFAAAAAEKYKGQIAEYEIWNEPNAGFRFWKPTLNGDPAKFATLVVDAARAIHAADASAKVAYGGTVFHDLVKGPDFESASFAASPDLAHAIDALAFHAYNVYPPSRAPESAVAYETPLADKIAITSGVLAQAGAPPMPLWLTEIGWPTTDSVSPDAQARYTVRAIVIAALSGVDDVFLYTLSDGPHPDAYPPEDAFGLLANDGAEKPAFGAVRDLMAKLGAFVVKRRVPAASDDVWVVELSDGSKSAWIAWLATDGAPQVSVTLPNGIAVSVTSTPTIVD